MDSEISIIKKEMDDYFIVLNIRNKFKVLTNFDNINVTNLFTKDDSVDITCKFF